MKKLLFIVAVGGAVVAFKRNKDAKADADIWREATAPVPGPASSNGSAPAPASRPASQN